jgi:hypothetical protein
MSFEKLYIWYLFKEIRPKDVQTIDEMLQENYSIYGGIYEKYWAREMEFGKQ